MKCFHGFAIRGAEANMHAAWCRRLRTFYRNRELDAKGAGHRAVVRAALLEINDSNKPKRSQHSIVEVTASVQIAHAQRNVVEHARLTFAFSRASLASAAMRG